MRSQEFKRWRKLQHLSQKQAAEALGLKRRVVQYYEKGERDGEKVKIPRSVRLACAALAHGLAEWKPAALKPAAQPKTDTAKAEKAKPEKAKPEKAKPAKAKPVKSKPVKSKPVRTKAAKAKRPAKPKTT